MSSTKKVTERYKPWPFVAKFLHLNKPWSCKCGRKKIDMYDFSVRDSTQEQNGSTPNFSSIVFSPKWPSLSSKYGWDPEILWPL